MHLLPTCNKPAGECDHWHWPKCHFAKTGTCKAGAKCSFLHPEGALAAPAAENAIEDEESAASGGSSKNERKAFAKKEKKAAVKQNAHVIQGKKFTEVQDEDFEKEQRQIDNELKALHREDSDLRNQTQ